jgi:non-ribosomal peptide synthetase component E (peptide arylation enzyme)
VQKGDRIAVSLGNNWEFATITYALFKLGAILVGYLAIESLVYQC